MAADPRLDEIATAIRDNPRFNAIPATHAVVMGMAAELKQQLPDLTADQVGAVLLRTAAALGRLAKPDSTYGDPGGVAMTNIVALLGYRLYTGRYQSTDPRKD